MNKQTENFKKLVKGSSINSIVTAINMLQNNTRNELFKEYNVKSSEELAFKLK